MARSRIVVGLDIGTSNIKILVVQDRGNEWEVLHCAQAPSFGLRKGAVVNAEEVSKGIQLLVSSAEKTCGLKIKSAFINIGGSHLYAKQSDGLISVSRADRIISQEDIDRVLQAARAVNIPPNEEVLDVFPKEFIVDEQKGIKQPLGLTGVRLGAKVILLCYFQSFFVNLSQAVLSSGLRIEDIVPSPLAAAKAVLTPQQKELGVALVDIGAATTSLAVFEEGELIHFAVLPLGSASITNDIAIGLKTEVAIAEEIKRKYGECLLSESGKTKKTEAAKKIEASATAPLSFSKKDLVYIIEPRVREIFDLIQKELKQVSRQEMLPGGIVLTGGGANLPRIKDLARQQLKLTCQIGAPGGIVGLEQDPALATVTGLVISGIIPEDSESHSAFGTDGFLGNLSSRLKKIFKAFVP